jgi:hypothetical protein
MLPFEGAVCTPARPRYKRKTVCYHFLFVPGYIFCFVPFRGTFTRDETCLLTETRNIRPTVSNPIM